MFGILQCGYLIIAINKCHMNLVQGLNEQFITQPKRQNKWILNESKHNLTSPESESVHGRR